MLFSWNLSPLRPKGFSPLYLLLPPRSALKNASFRVTPRISLQSSRLPTHKDILQKKGNFFSNYLYGYASGESFSVINFQGWFIWLVSCYTLLSEFRLPWPSSSCLYESTPFMVSKLTFILTPLHNDWFISFYQFCLPKVAH